jgi:hypothetical protein
VYQFDTTADAVKAAKLRQMATQHSAGRHGMCRHPRWQDRPSVRVEFKPVDAAAGPDIDTYGVHSAAL